MKQRSRVDIKTEAAENSATSVFITVSKMRVELTRPIGHYPLKVARLPIPPPGQKMRAKDGTRTRDPDLGKVVLYQLSYFRNQCAVSSTKVCFKER